MQGDYGYDYQGTTSRDQWVLGRQERVFLQVDYGYDYQETASIMGRTIRKQHHRSVVLGREEIALANSVSSPANELRADRGNALKTRWRTARAQWPTVSEERVLVRRRSW